MRTNRSLRTPSATQLAAGVLILALPTTAVAVGVADAQGPGPTLQASVSHPRIGYDGRATVRGTAPAADAGRPVTLQFEAATGREWRSIATSTIKPGGGFVFRARLRRSGMLQVVPATASSAHTTLATTSTGATPLAASRVQPVEVDARFNVRARPIDAVAGDVASIRGRLLPGTDGRVVRLMTNRSGHWTTLAKARTGSAGGFDLRYRVPSTGTTWLRVSFGGDRSNPSSWSHAGELIGLRESVASWYEDGGNTACGFHAIYGVANRTLPCGTKVTFVYGGHSVTATVDDRGPYVGGRDYDLNQNTAGALGVSGVATVLSSI